MFLLGRLRAAFAVLVLVGLCALPPAARAETGLFNSSEIHSISIGSFTNWTGVMGRVQHAMTLGEGICATAGADFKNRCPWDEWQKLLGETRSLDRMAQLKRVNDYMNRKRYTLDRNNWGREDYWASIFEFLEQNGDCEDYAIAKYVTLRELGWPTDSLRLVIVKDTKLDLNHAILAIYTDEGIYIADNQVDGLVKAERIRHYRPIYSINEDGWWLHRPQRRG